MLNFSEKKACVSRHSLSVLFMCGQFWEARLHLWKNVVANLHLDWIHSQEPLTWANAETEGFPSHHLHVQGSLRDWSPGPKIANFFFFSIYFVPGTVYVLLKCRASLIAQLVNHLPAMQETQVRFLGRERSSGEGNGNPLKYSCLENPRVGGSWWAAVYGVAQSRTRLKRLSSSSSSMCLYENSAN